MDNNTKIIYSGRIIKALEMLGFEGKEVIDHKGYKGKEFQCSKEFDVILDRIMKTSRSKNK